MTRDSPEFRCPETAVLPALTIRFLVDGSTFRNPFFTGELPINHMFKHHIITSRPSPPSRILADLPLAHSRTTKMSLRLDNSPWSAPFGTLRSHSTRRRHPVVPDCRGRADYPSVRWMRQIQFKQRLDPPIAHPLAQRRFVGFAPSDRGQPQFGEPAIVKVSPGGRCVVA